MSNSLVTKANPGGIEQLPQELVDKVIDQLGPDLEALKTCALVTRRWLAHSLYNLSQYAWLRIRGHDDTGIGLLRALDEDQSFAQKIVHLSVDNIAFLSVRTITTLPYLRELRVNVCDVRQDDVRLLGKAQSVNRTLAILHAFKVPLILLHSLLQGFSSVETLRLHGMEGTNPLPDDLSSPKQHYVRNLDLINVDKTVLQYLSATLHIQTLRSLTVDMHSISGEQWEHPGLVHDFVQAAGHALTEYHHVLCKSFIYTTPDLPALTALTNLVTVTLVLDIWSCEREQGRIAAFMRALPAHTRLVKVTFWYDIVGESQLVEVAEMVEWTKLFEGLEQCAGLVHFDVLVKSNRRRKAHVPPPPDLAACPAAQAIVLEKLPARVRSLTRFP